MRFQLDTLHTPIVWSLDPDVKYSPFGENATLFTWKGFPVRDFMRFPLGTLHTIIFLSEDPEAKYSPVGENITLLT